jgi:hypothetical protein
MTTTLSPASTVARNQLISSACWSFASSLLCLAAPFYFWQRQDMTTWLWVGVGITWIGFVPVVLLFLHTTRMNWHGLKMSKLLDEHAGRSESSLLAGFLNAYSKQHGRTSSFALADCFRWVNKSRSILNADSLVEALEELEKSGDIAIYRPADGDLVILLTKQFHQRMRFTSHSTH